MSTTTTRRRGRRRRRSRARGMRRARATGRESSTVFFKLATALEQASIGPTSLRFALGMVFCVLTCRVEGLFQLPILSLVARRKPPRRETTLLFFSCGLCSRHVEVSDISKAGPRPPRWRQRPPTDAARCRSYRRNSRASLTPLLQSIAASSMSGSSAIRLANSSPTFKLNRCLIRM